MFDEKLLSNVLSSHTGDNMSAVYKGKTFPDLGSDLTSIKDSSFHYYCILELSLHFDC